MALNPFFLQGSPGEQRLIQNLINEQLQIYGVEVTYIPRKFVNKKSIIEEVQSSKFDDNFLIEAYVNTYEGYSGAGDIMTKFGVSLRDEITLTISKERFEDFIAPYLNDDEYELATRPREGDLIFFPLGTRLFEVKFVEHEQPFYQLGKNYVYQLQCELFEYEDEVIDTGVEEIDQEIEEDGFITTLNLVGTGVTATATAAISVNSGYLNSITLLNDGSGYTGTPTVSISTSRVSGGTNASAVAITTERSGVFSIKEIILTNPGSGYTFAPSIKILGGNGSGAIATCNVVTSGQGVINFNITQEGRGYTTNPAVTVAGPVGVGTTALVTSIIDIGSGQLSSFRFTNPGAGYTVAPAVTIAEPDIITGRGNYLYNDLVVGQTSNTEARVRSWDADTKVLKVANVGIGSTVRGFIPGEEIRIQTGIGATGLKIHKTVFTAGFTTTGLFVGAGTTFILVGSANTTKFNVGDDVDEIENVIGAGVTVHSILSNGNILLSEDTLNTTNVQNQTISIGSTSFISYNVREYDNRDIYDDYSSNDEFELEADEIIDFAETNPFGTY
ncbi:MAG: hypothetical protein CL852_01550 [Crocinitomicaceae bacterium]|nr:hypothetical protein [Crocinitomicaceae bacterium]|tara:strand:+ start:9424 stop:11097 length:1674 start_codon:yes stop_codon:yes gene_type:complete